MYNSFFLRMNVKVSFCCLTANLKQMINFREKQSRFLKPNPPVHVYPRKDLRHLEIYLPGEARYSGSYECYLDMERAWVMKGCFLSLTSLFALWWSLKYNREWEKKLDCDRVSMSIKNDRMGQKKKHFLPDERQPCVPLDPLQFQAHTSNRLNQLW